MNVPRLKQYPARQQKDQCSQYGLFFSPFIHLTNSKIYKRIIKGLVLIGIANKECVRNAEGWCERERFTLMNAPHALLFPSAQLQQDLTVIARCVPLENEWIVLK